jgi:hypothetical protein
MSLKNLGFKMQKNYLIYVYKILKTQGMDDVAGIARKRCLLTSQHPQVITATGSRQSPTGCFVTSAPPCASTLSFPDWLKTQKCASPAEVTPAHDFAFLILTRKIIAGHDCHWQLRSCSSPVLRLGCWSKGLFEEEDAVVHL